MGAAARARQHRDVAEGEPPASAMAPPRVQSAARKIEGEMSSPATIEPPVIFATAAAPPRCASTRSRISTRSAGTGTEIFIFRRAITCDLGVERRTPGMVGGNTRRDGVVGPLRQRIIFQHRDLELQNVRDLAVNRRDQFGDLAVAPSIAAFSAGRLAGGIAGRSALRNGGRQHGDRPDGEARRGGTAGEIGSRSPRHASPKSVMDQRQHGDERRLAVGTGDAEIQRRTLRRLHTHHLHGTLGVRPGPIRREGEFDLGGKTFARIA